MRNTHAALPGVVTIAEKYSTTPTLPTNPPKLFDTPRAAANRLQISREHFLLSFKCDKSLIVNANASGCILGVAVYAFA
jgi:hypothetical protein